VPESIARCRSPVNPFHTIGLHEAVETTKIVVEQVHDTTKIGSFYFGDDLRMKVLAFGARHAQQITQRIIEPADV